MRDMIRFGHKFRVSNFSCYLRVARIALWQNTSETGATFVGVSENAEESPGKFWPLQNGENMMRIHDPDRISTGVPYVGPSGGGGLLFAPNFCGASLQLTK